VARAGTVVFGVGMLHHLPLHLQRMRLLRMALDLGFRNFDVAPAYGNGLNEVELGRALGDSRLHCHVTTKFGIPADLYGARHPRMFALLRGARRMRRRHYGEEYKRRVFSSSEMASSLEGSLRRLRRDYIDDFLIHEPLGVLATHEVASLHETAHRLKEQGKILRWGVAGTAVSIAQFASDPMIDVVQFPLEDVQQVVAVPPKRRIAFGVYRSYLASRADRDIDFATFVRDRCTRQGLDFIVGTTSVTTLTSFRDLIVQKGAVSSP
jgi:aryl-alcohol dehydrogenase-like predicted oxidoreductase